MGRDVAAPEHLRWFTQLVELSPDALVLVDGEGHIIVANHRAEEMFGYSSQDLLELSVDSLVPTRYRPEHSAHRGMYLLDPRTRMMGDGRLDLHGLRKDGSEFPAEIALTAVPTDAGLITAAAIRDVSDRLRADRERAELVARLERQQTTAQASRMESIGQLAGGIAHDFNNLLSVVIGNVEFLTAQLTPGTAEHDEAREILDAAKRAATLTKQLLLFSRREVVEPEPVDLNATVTDVERLLRRTIGEHVLLVTDLAPGLPLMLGDPGSLEQVLVNLAVNARDAMPNGGTLTIATDAVTTDPDAADAGELRLGDYVRLSVTDTGVGMSPEVAARAFEPFFSTKPKPQGTGLGLATVYSIALQFKGYVSIKSVEGQGTTVTVEFPRMHADAASERAQAAAASDLDRGAGNQEHVLLVEDDQAVRKVAAQILVRAGYRVTSASGGAEALEVLERPDTEVDVMITDVIMPGMLGPELAERATAVRPGLPVVLMSGYVDPLIDLRRFSRSAMVQKPFTEASLTQALRSALARR